jgi:hypothetical protein
MKGRKYSAEQIVSKLREGDVLLSQGAISRRSLPAPPDDRCYLLPVAQGVRDLSIDQARRLKELEAENARLRKVIADLSMENAILKEVSRGKL